MYDVKIKGVSNGWIVTIGCKTFVSEDKDKMLKSIGDYIDSPQAEEDKWMKNAKNDVGVDLACDESANETCEEEGGF